MFRHYTRLGIIKGGQLGRMLIQSCMDYGLQSLVMDKDPDAPCRHYCCEFVPGDSDCFEDVYRFGKKVDVLTLEFEHVNIDALFKLRDEGLVIHPGPDVVALIQDKGTQKEFFRRKGFPTADFVLTQTPEDLQAHRHRLPLVQKLRHYGYDGKGVYKIRSAADLAGALTGPSVLEDHVDFVREIAVIVARNSIGQIVTYPVVEMEFSPEAHLLEFLFAPAEISPRLADQASDLARQLAEELNLVGLLAVEMFVTSRDQILINEIAPRPHNSGHHTIEANATSQYEQLLRAVLDLPLGDPSALRAAVMVNLIGEKGHHGLARYAGVEEVLKVPGIYLHLYGKRETRPFRKMGHITIIDHHLNLAKEKARWVKQTVRVVV